MKAFVGQVTSMGGDTELAFNIPVQVCTDGGNPLKQLEVPVPYQVTDTTQANFRTRVRTVLIDMAKERGINLITSDVIFISL